MECLNLSAAFAFRQFLLNFGWPQARLTFYTEGIKLGPSCFLFFYTPRRSFRYDDLAEVQAIGSSILALGIRFTKRESGEWVIIWAVSRRSRTRILELLDQRTSVVKSAPTSLDIFNAAPPADLL